MGEEDQKRPAAVGYESHLTSSGPLMFDVPEPVPGCGVCDDFTERWLRVARRRTPDGQLNPERDPTEETDVIVLMRRHKEATHGESK